MAAEAESCTGSGDPHNLDETSRVGRLNSAAGGRCIKQSDGHRKKRLKVLLLKRVWSGYCRNTGRMRFEVFRDKDVARLQDFQELEVVLEKGEGLSLFSGTGALTDRPCYNMKASRLTY
ncbi:unnamed protein product [Boreogadus saida]